MTMPALALCLRARYAMAGVGMMPASIARPPAEQMPAVSADSNISPEMRVSRPMMMSGCSSDSLPK